MKNSSLLLAYVSMEIVTGTLVPMCWGRHGCSGLSGLDDEACGNAEQTDTIMKDQRMGPASRDPENKPGTELYRLLQ